MRRKSRRPKIIKFIQVTQQLLEVPLHIIKNEEFSDIIKWSDDGKRIIIHNKEQLQSIVLPKYFKHANYASFLRQLNMYGFTNCKDQDGVQAYAHPSFTQKQTIMKQIKKRKKQEPPSIPIETYQTEFTELKEQILVLQEKQSKIQKDLMQSLECQIKMQHSINKLLLERMKIAQTGIQSTRNIVQVIQILVKQMKPDHQFNYMHLFQQLFPEEYMESQIMLKKQIFTETIEMPQTQFLYSPLPFGQFVQSQTPILDLLSQSPCEFNNNCNSQI